MTFKGQGKISICAGLNIKKILQTAVGGGGGPSTPKKNLYPRLVCIVFFSANPNGWGLHIDLHIIHTGRAYIPIIRPSVHASVCLYVSDHLYLRHACANVADIIVIHQDPVPYDDYAR